MHYCFYSDWSDGMTSSSSVLLVNSIIISASLYSPNCTLNTTDLSRPVQITLHHVNQSLDDPTCSFLDDKRFDHYSKHNQCSILVDYYYYYYCCVSRILTIAIHTIYIYRPNPIYTD